MLEVRGWLKVQPYKFRLPDLKTSSSTSLDMIDFASNWFKGTIYITSFLIWYIVQFPMQVQRPLKKIPCLTPSVRQWFHPVKDSPVEIYIRQAFLQFNLFPLFFLLPHFHLFLMVIYCQFWKRNPVSGKFPQVLLKAVLKSQLSMF